MLNPVRIAVAENSGSSFVLDEANKFEHGNASRLIDVHMQGKQR